MDYDYHLPDFNPTERLIIGFLANRSLGEISRIATAACALVVERLEAEGAARPKSKARTLPGGNVVLLRPPG